MSYDRYGVNTRNSFNMKPKHRMSNNYDREIYLSEYTPINKEHYRRLRFCTVVSVGINVFLLLVMVLR
jgi:hypothetical protein